jgi:hypothetical protein
VLANLCNFCWRMHTYNNLKAEVAEKSQVSRAALIATREANIDALNDSLKIEVECRKRAEAVADMNTKLKNELELRLKDMLATHEKELQALEASKSILVKSHSEEVSELRKNHELELQKVRDDHK